MASETSGPGIGRGKKLTALALVIVLIAVTAVAYVMLAGDSNSDAIQSDVTLLLTHYNPSYADPARVAIYVDGIFQQNVSIDVGANETILFELAEGNHTIGFDYTIAPSAEPDGVIDAEGSIEITSSDPRELSWEVGSGIW